ncbi:MAG: hypothetical protein DRP71_00365 [Verrucomicrobia bacterium]|nr:MAG: hypothetical protein DRP71_00365 [Verrucomicrobiota bacterium]
MAKNPDNPEEGSEFNKIDLTAFEDFSFGTQWTEATGPSKGGDTDRRREGGPPRKDRRPPRRFPSRDQDGPRPDQPRRSFEAPHGDRRPDRRGPPRRPEGEYTRRSFRDHQPYVSDIFEVAFYPEEHGFNALVKAMRTSCRTYELFEIARLILGKPERCVVVFRRTAGEDNKHPKVAISIPDGMPFESEEEAVKHVLSNHLDRYFDIGEIEVDPPKGNFQVVHRCPVTKELLGPPNYHRYSHIVEQHHAMNVSHIPLERYRSSLVSSREEEDIQAWLEKMKSTVRYTSKPDLTEETGSFDSLEEARSFALRSARAKMVKLADGARIEARVIQKFPGTEAERAMEGALERQQRFPLDTANALRGRLRRENFHIFKRGSKGITYACSVRRKFRLPGQSFADSVQNLISHLEANPMAPVATIPEAFLGISIHGAHEGDSAGIESLPEDKKEALKRMAMDLRWLVTEGYVAEYSDGRLFAAPAAQEPSPKKEKKAAAHVEKPKQAGESKASKPTDELKEPEAAVAAASVAAAEDSKSPAEIRLEDKAAEEKPGRSESVPEEDGEPPSVAEQVTTPEVVSDSPMGDESEPEPASQPGMTTAGTEEERPEVTEEAPTAEERTEPTRESETTAEQTEEEKGADAVAEPEVSESEEQASTTGSEDEDPGKKSE